MPTKKKNYCKVLDPADFEAWGITRRKQWEVRMALDCLRDHGAVHKDANILGVGAGAEATIYHLSNEVRLVTATDLYLDAGQWAEHAPRQMILDPSIFAKGIKHDPLRIKVQHADMMNLPYEDNSFDGVFSSGSIEHVPSFEHVQKAIKEMARVVKPGGVISLSTEWRLSGTGHGWAGVLLFDPETLVEHIVEPSGCEYEGISSPAILDAEPYPLEEIVANRRPEVEMVLSSQHGYTFTSVHIVLVKPKPKPKPEPKKSTSTKKKRTRKKTSS